MSCFHGHYHLHVEQNYERTSDGVDDDSDDVTNLQRDFSCVAFGGCHFSEFEKIADKLDLLSWMTFED